MKYISKFAALTALCVLLSGCGSDNDDSDVSSDPKVNQAPVANDDSWTVAVSETTELDVLANDTDADGDVLTITAVTEAAHGSVAIVDGKMLSYTAQADYMGEDSFSYTISDGTDTDTATVTLSIQQKLALSGRIVDSPIANARVSATIGEREFQTEADADGYYELTLYYSDGEQLLNLQAQGAEQHGQQYVDLTSLLPSLNQLQQQAGDDGVLDRDDNTGTYVTNVTTAQHLLLLEANGGEALTDAERLAAVETSVDANAVLELAAVIKLVIDDQRYALPDGSESITQFVSDKASYNSFVEQVEAENPGLLEQTVADIVADEQLVYTSKTATLPSHYLMFEPSTRGFVSVGGGAVYFNQDGTGYYLPSNYPVTSENTDKLIKHTFSWLKDDDGFFHMTFDPETAYRVESRDYKEIGDQKNVSIVSMSTFTDMRFKVLTHGQQVDTVLVEMSYLMTYEPYVDSANNEYVFDDEVVVYTRRTSYTNGDKYQSLNFNREKLLSSAWAVTLATQAEANIFSTSGVANILNFDSAGHFASNDNAIQGTWQLNDAATQLDLSYGQMTQKIQLLTQNGEVFGAYSVIDNGSRQTAVYERIAEVNPKLAITAESMLTEAGQYWQLGSIVGMKSSWISADKLTLQAVSGFQYTSPTAGYRVDISCDEGTAYNNNNCRYESASLYINASKIDWLLKQDGTIEADNFEQCVPDEPYAICQTRRMLPLDVSEDGQTIIVLEEIGYIDFDSGSPVYESSMSPRVSTLLKRDFPNALTNQELGYAESQSALTQQMPRVSFLPRN